jgi:hypothetical protein
MNNLHRAVVLSGLLAVPITAAAQITITAADIAARMAVGNKTTLNTDSLTRFVNIGAPGASSWDFSGLTTSASNTLTSVAVATTPYASKFPGATHALQTNLVYQGINATGYIYLFLGGSTLQNPGTMGGPPPIPGLKVEVRLDNSPADIVYVFPSSLDTTWRSTYTETSTTLLNDSPSGTPTVTTHDALYTIDAYGPMTIPGGGVHQVLRMRKEDWTSRGKALSYIFLALNGASVQLTAADTLQPTSGTIAISIASWSGPVVTDVQTEPGVPATFALQQNWPNPFNPSTKISFDLPQRSQVLLKVFSVLGEEVATLLNAPVEAGRTTVDFTPERLPSGVYLYRIQADGFTATRKMVYLR